MVWVVFLKPKNLTMLEVEVVAPMPVWVSGVDMVRGQFTYDTDPILLGLISPAFAYTRTKFTIIC